MGNLHSQLRRFLSDDRILDTELWREVYGRDASYFDIKPQAVVRPQTVDEIRQLLAMAAENRIGVTFRTGGTSLCGQSVNTGIICELRTGWHDYEVRPGGTKVWFQPGITAQRHNAGLKPYGHKIGPDPASSCAAMMGGILSNNSSGMEAGVRHNSYHTLSSIEFVLANGHRYISSVEADRKRFCDDERELAAGLAEIRREILADPETTEKITRKYKIKNVTGYAMNSFVDYEHPMDIFAHLLIGSEGTLAYIVAGELNTIPLYTDYSSAMLYFDSVTSAAAQAKYLGDTGALAVEMMDYASLCSYLGKRADLPPGTTAMLIDYGGSSAAELADTTGSLTPGLKKLRGLTRMDPFTTTVKERADLWAMRNGIFPCVAGVRKPGDAVILEDVAAPVERLDMLVDGVHGIFKKYGFDGSIFGHARDGNIHPLLTSPIYDRQSKEKFRGFMDDLVDAVLRLDGSLKGEHGTGRAIAPFVAREWGDKIYGLMKRVKTLADPAGVLNPGVMINSDPECFMENIKQLPEFGAELGYAHADKCMECGYCEHVCPTRESTLTPRQRLQARRIIVSRPELEKEYRFIGQQSCCSDGSCQMPCPMHINTGTITDAVRTRTNPRLFKDALSFTAKDFGPFESSIRSILKAAVLTEKVISPYPLIWASDFMHKVYSQVPHWSRHFPMPAKIHWQETAAPDYLYFPACVTRIFGGSTLHKDDLITVIMRIASRAGIRVSLPREMHGLCCSQIWSHKGDPKGHAITVNKTVERFYELSDSGRIPIFCDTSSCTHTLLRDMEASLTEENKRKYAALKIMDITEWLLTVAMPRLKVTKPKGTVLLHPTCAARIIGVDGIMREIAQKCAREVVVPLDCQCCGAAGDRGFMFPKIAGIAVKEEKADIAGRQFDGCYSLARTCEISMTDTIGRPYEPLAYLVDETTE